MKIIARFPTITYLSLIISLGYPYATFPIRTGSPGWNDKKIADPSRNKRSIDSTLSAGPKTPRKSVVDLKETTFRGGGRNKEEDAKKSGKKTFSTMNFDELKQAKEKYKQENNTPVVIKYLERMIRLANDINDQAASISELADVYFEQQEYDKAEALYTEFCTLFPGNEGIEHALFRATTSCAQQTLDAERDQSKTHATIALADKYLSRKVFTKHRQEVKRIRTECFKKLAESEMSICTFYLNQGSLQAVENRLKDVREKYLPEAPSIQTQLVAFEKQLKIQQDELNTQKTVIAMEKEHKKQKTDFTKRF